MKITAELLIENYFVPVTRGFILNGADEYEIAAIWEIEVETERELIQVLKEQMNDEQKKLNNE